MEGHLSAWQRLIQEGPQSDELQSDGKLHGAQWQRDITLPSYEGPNSEEYEDGKFPSVGCSMSWPSSGPSEDSVPRPALCQDIMEISPSQHDQRGHAERVAAPPPPKPNQEHDLGELRNPVPSSGTRRDACGCVSIGSAGHESGNCAGPCKDLRSGRGCTFGRKCKLCHLPHPEISSSSIRKRRTAAKKLVAQFLDDGGSDNGKQVAWFEHVPQNNVQPQQQERGTYHGQSSSSGLAAFPGNHFQPQQQDYGIYHGQSSSSGLAAFPGNNIQPQQQDYGIYTGQSDPGGHAAYQYYQASTSYSL
eukprot:TRINITY_DN4427_c0_g1_i1.p1 TRINITY_DN4427_c0_g1~~TRINITY_DN4427_c0_g1_i1.p1  ORF type:complete len:304 (+),score=4.02 TRINITY_DN4427_c0_g1_i1:56-967(+)